MGKFWFFGKKATRKREKVKGLERERGAPPSGCMGSMLQLLNFSNAKSDYFIVKEPIATKGKISVEAPKNSLEKEEPLKAKENLFMPIGIRIKTSDGSVISNIRNDTKSNDSSLDLCAASPSTNTSNLVARLMGLNYLPENFSPSLSSLNPSKLSKANQKEFLYQKNHSFNGRYSLNIDISGSRSLPESPRVSASRRSDVDHHRLSVQSCKENTNAFDEFKSLGRNKKVKQEIERESPGRNFGTDISNSSMRNKEQRRDHILLAKPKKPLEKKNKENQVSNLSLRGVKEKKENADKKIKSFESQRFGQNSKRIPKSSDVLRNKKEEMFVRKSKENRETKSKKMPILGEILNMSGTPIIPVKKEPLSPTKLPSKKESEVHSSKRRTKPYNPLMTCHGSSNGVTQAQSHYIVEVLKFLGIDENTPLSFAKLHSPSHPLHPSVFNCLELTFSSSKDSQLRHRSNRKLVFELVDEILVDVLRPYLILKPWVFSNIRNDYRRDGSRLIDQLFANIQSLQEADCIVLEDIDRLIDKDFKKAKFHLSAAFEEESEIIVKDLESDIMESLVHEMVADVKLNWYEWRF